MRRRERIYPPNCTVCDLNPSRFLAFRAKQNEVEAEYGFRLCVPRRTEAERDGYRRYMRDYRRRYSEAHREERKAYRHAYWVNVTKRGFDSKAEAEGDVEKLKRRAEKKKRTEYEERRRQIHEQYGFWLNTPPRTSEEEAGRARYRKEQDAARKERNHDKIVAYQKAHNVKRREENERRFLARLKQMEAKDPIAAEKFKAKHEKLCRIQHMTHEERVRYRQQKQFERLQAQAERKRKREEERRLRAERKAEEKRLRKPRVEKPRISRLETMRLEQAEHRKEREAQAAALLAAECEARKAYAAEREANRAAYLAAKAAKREEGTGKREEIGVSHPCAIAEQPPVAPVASVFAVPVAPTSSSGGGEPPKEPPIVTTGGEPPEDDSSPSPDDAVTRREAEFRHQHLNKVRKLAAKKRKATIARKKREAAAQAAREAKAAELAAQAKAREEARQAARAAKQEAIEAAAAAKVERKALLEQAYATFGYKVKAYENKKLNMRRRLGLPKMKRDFTPEQRETWNTYLRESRAELENWLAERMRKELANAGKRGRDEERKASVAETLAAREKRKKEREERKRLIFEKYGFTLGKAPVTPEEIEGFKRWQRDQDAEYRERHRDRITAYNREYRRRKRAEALAKQQTTWTPEQLAAWEKHQARKQNRPGTPQWMVSEVVKHIAAEQNLPEDMVMERVLELGGLDFIIKGAESMGQQRCSRPSAVIAAVRALTLYLDPDNAAMFGGRRKEGTGKREERKGEEIA